MKLIVFRVNISFDDTPKVFNGFKSGDAGGQFINRDPKMPILARYNIEFLAACEGALSCMKTSDFFLFRW